MTNTNNSKAVAGSKPRTLPGLFEVSTLDDGTVVIKNKAPREVPLIDDGKAKNGPVSNA
jgi:hypothetical protein